MRTNNQGRNLTLLGGKIVIALTIIAALLLTFAGPNQPYVHAAGLNYDPTTKSADSLPTNSPDVCLAWDGIRSQLTGSAPAEFVTIPNMGVVEIDDTVYANGCSKAFASNLIMSGLVYVHWSEWNGAIGTPPAMTITLNSQAVVHGINATWSAGVGANAGANAGTNTGSGSSASGSAGASANFNFSISPTDSTILNSTSTISNQTSALFTYQNLSASVTAAAGAQVTQTDAITITVNQNAQPVHYEKAVTPFT